MANPELGAKQVCPSCASKFYDLNRRPAHCPKCAAEFDPEEALRSRRVRPRGPLPEEETEVVKAAPEAEVEEEAEAEAAPELDEGAEAEPLEASDEDEDGAEAKPAAPDEALGVDFTEDDEDLEESDDDVPFIEDDEDEFSENEIDGLPDEGEAVV